MRGAGGRLLDVHPQPVDLPRGGGEVTLQLQLPLTQSAMENISNNQYIIEGKKYKRIIQLA